MPAAWKPPRRLDWLGGVPDSVKMMIGVTMLKIADLARTASSFPLREWPASWNQLTLFDPPAANNLDEELLEAITLAVAISSIDITTKKSRDVLKDLKNIKGRFDGKDLWVIGSFLPNWIRPKAKGECRTSISCS